MDRFRTAGSLIFDNSAGGLTPTLPTCWASWEKPGFAQQMTESVDLLGNPLIYWQANRLCYAWSILADHALQECRMRFN
jgi:hypothetical protein